MVHTITIKLLLLILYIEFINRSIVVINIPSKPRYAALKYFLIYVLKDILR